MGKIAKDKQRISLVITKEDRDYLQKVADADDRTLSNLISKILKEYVQFHKEHHPNIEETDMPEI